MRNLFALALLCGAASAQDQGPAEPLSRAALNGDVSEVRALLARGANPNVRDEDGQTPLMRAASVMGRERSASRQPGKSDYQGVATALLDHGADVNAREQGARTVGRTALMLALLGSASEYKVIGGDDGMARLLIARGAEVNARDDLGWTPVLLVLDLWADQPALLEFLLAKGADVHAQLKDGRTGLMLAAHLGKTERLVTLIAHGAEVNARDQSGATVLMVAALVRWDEASIEMLRLLADKGADLNLKDQRGRTAADRAAEAGHLERALFLIDRGTKVADRKAFLSAARNRALLRAIDGGSVETARTLLEQGADANYRDETDRTVLMIAAGEEYSADRATLLLEHGASVNLAGRDGDTPLMIAADRYQPDIVKVLLARGADASAADRQGNTVLMRAAASKHGWQEERTPLIPQLLAKGADPRPRNAHGVTALMLMAREGNPALRLLFEKNVEVDARDDQGNTALLYAARFFARGWQRRNGWALLQNGADANAANDRGETALILASTQYESDAAELLLRKGANPNAQTKTGRTALMQAIDGPKEFDNDNHVVYSPRIAELLIGAGADVNARDAAGATALQMALRRGYQDMAAALREAGAKE